jgi:UPF0716 family protein affecting phage T7 exclusion
MKRLVTFKYSRVIYGTLFSIAGIFLMLIPLIPGYVFLFIGILLLYHRVPFLKRFIFWLKKKDSKGYLTRVEEKVNAFFGKSQSTATHKMDSPD